MKYLSRWSDVVLVAIFLLLFIVNLLQVFFRYVIGASLTWSEELARHLFVWVTFLGMALVTRDKDNIVIDILPSPTGGGRVLGFIEAVQKIITAIIMIVLLYLSVRYVWSVYDRGLLSPAMDIPLWIPTISLVVGTLLSARHISAHFYKEHILSTWDPKREDREAE